MSVIFLMDSNVILPGDEDDDSPFGALENVLIGWLLTLESSRSL